MNLNPIKAAIAPYVIWIKLGLMVVIFLGGAFTGCRWEASNNQEQIADLTKWRQYYFDQASTNADALKEVNKQYKANKQAAEEWKQRADEASEAADAERRANQRQQDTFEKELEKAKRDPNCKAIMQLDLCPLLRDY